MKTDGYFLGPLVIRDESTNDGPWFVLVQDLDFFSRIAGCVIRATAGTGTDFASIPRLLWRILPPSGSAYDAPAVIHDKLYREQEIEGERITRATADAIFGEAMKAKNVPAWKRCVILTGLKIGGFVAWNNYAKNL